MAVHTVKQSSAPAPQNDTESTVRIDMDGLFGRNSSSGKSADQGPLRVENLKLDPQDLIGTLSRKPPEKYQFLNSIGRGGMKLVIQVKDRDTTRDIAMAMLPDAANRSQKDIVRFIEEARITASLEHPNIVPVHDIGVDQAGTPYFTMKLLKGETFGSILKKIDAGDPEYLKNYPLEKLLQIFLKICNAVAFAHSKGVLHLDLKPENVQVGDFGEVLLMDWGLARVLTESQSDPDQESSTVTALHLNPGIREAGDIVTRDGITKGTPGYMAPEQAAGRNSHQDFRTDVYALGAILYTIVTGKNPLDTGKPMAKMMIDTITGNIDPPHLRVLNHPVPVALEAVILKAMSVRQEDRYPSVKELRDEVYAFLGGYATEAERATPIKKGLLLLRRHRITSLALGILIVLAIGTGIYFIRDLSRQKGDWIGVYEQTFSGTQNGLEEFSFYNRLLTSLVPPWKSSAEGLRMLPDEWIWLTGLDLQGNQRIELEVKTLSPDDSITVCMNAPLSPLKFSWQLPAGYSARIAGHAGALDMICRTEEKAAPVMIAAGDCRIRPNAWNRISFERSGGLFRLTVNGHAIQTTDLFPVETRSGRIGIHAEGTVLLRSVRASRLALPQKASPVIAGDTLLEGRHYQEAIDKYLLLADNYGRGPIAEEALVKAFHTAASFLENREQRRAMMNAVRNRIDGRFPNFRYREHILELETLIHWKEEHFSDAFFQMEEVFNLNPNTAIVQKILQLRHRKLPPSALDGLLSAAAQTKNLRRLNLSGLGITSLYRLRKLNLISLDCSDNQLETLEGLENMPLEVLVCSGNKLHTLKSLQKCPLRSLDCSGNQLTNLSGLRTNVLKTLLADENRLRKLTADGAFPVLEVLSLRGNQLNSLSVLKEAPLLRKLSLGKNPIRSLDGISQFPLEYLAADFCPIRDLEPLRNLPLIVLVLTGCREVTNLSPLQEMTTLETLYLPPEAKEFENLRQLPALTYIYECAPGEESTSGHLSAERFWERFDAGSNSRSK